MGTIANTPLVSNKVFKAIQPYQVIEDAPGTVIYANKYADVAEVPMPDYVKNILDSDAGTVGTNPLIQLQGKLQYLGDGPWYTDCRNGMLYIHNKKQRDDSIHTYVYQSENGEVIRVSFETQRIKHVDVAKALGIDPKTKQIEQEKSAAEEPRRILQEKYIELNDATKVNNIYRKYIEYYIKPLPKDYLFNKMERDSRLAHGRPDPETIGLSEGQKLWMDLSQIGMETGAFFSPDSKEAADWQAKNMIGKQNQTRKDNQMVHAVNAHFRKKALNSFYKDWKENNSLTLSPNKQVVNNAVSKETAKKEYDLTEDLGLALYQAKKKNKDPRPALKAIVDRYLGVGATHTYISKVWKHEYVDPTTYSGKNTFNYNPRPLSDASYAGHKPEVNLAAKNGYEGMCKDPEIRVIGSIDHNPEKPRYFQVEVFRLTNHKVQVSLGKEVVDWALRSAGYDEKDGGWKKNKMANDAASREEKRLVVKMDVIGRPTLTSSQTLTILNVGQRWSGTYYIKTCTHRMDASEGYICSIELSKNKPKPKVHTKEDKLHTDKIIKDNSSDNDHSKKRGATKTISKSVVTTTRATVTPSKTKRQSKRKSTNTKPSKRRK